MSGDSASPTPNNRDLDPTGGVGAAMGTTPDGPPTKNADRLSATNSKVESAMNHRRRRAVLQDSGFS